MIACPVNSVSFCVQAPIDKLIRRKLLKGEELALARSRASPPLSAYTWEVGQGSKLTFGSSFE